MWQGCEASVALGWHLCAAEATDVAAGWGKVKVKREPRAARANERLRWEEETCIITSKYPTESSAVVGVRIGAEDGTEQSPLVSCARQSYSEGERERDAEGEGEAGGQAVAGGEGEEEAGKTFAKGGEEEGEAGKTFAEGGEAFAKAGKGDEYCRRLAELVPEVGDCAETAETASRVTTMVSIRPDIHGPGV
ncbi:hypothetical protein P692DRAFT_201806284 [Suillus brevipes Sb2]|nr:hypothetical protein P692DRAFT_201806284 [Suillus brevipes Sb2]